MANANLTVDLGATKTVDSVQALSASSVPPGFSVQGSTDAKTWTTLGTQSPGSVRITTVTFPPATECYLRYQETGAAAGPISSGSDTG